MSKNISRRAFNSFLMAGASAQVLPSILSACSTSAGIPEALEGSGAVRNVR